MTKEIIKKNQQHEKEVIEMNKKFKQETESRE